VPEQSARAWPAIPFAEWRDTCATLHLWTQIVGKTRLALAPPENHWWHTALSVTSRGLTTSPMPSRGGTITVDFDFLDHCLLVQTSDGEARRRPLTAEPVADFYAAYTETLRELGHAVKIRPVPVELERVIPFADDREHASYEPDAAHRWWQALVRADSALKRFRGEFLGKASPVLFWWGSFDLASARFSGRRAPRYAGHVPNTPDYVMTEAYSHECSSCGFWPGNDRLPEPAFYAYAYPEPAGYAERPAGAEGAYYHPELGEFILPWESVRTAADPEAAVLAFCRATYAAAADLGGWDRAALERSSTR